MDDFIDRERKLNKILKDAASSMLDSDEEEDPYEIPGTAFTLIRLDTEKGKKLGREYEMDPRYISEHITLHEIEFLKCEKAAGQ